MNQCSLEDFKKKQMEILHELDRVCKILGINYFLAYGTCLGAVRHNGFIPWDDDIDVFITWKDMEILLKNTKKFKDNYFLQSTYTEKNYSNMKFSLRDSSTTYFSEEKDDEDINHGMFIDLYVLYTYPDNFIKAHILIIESFILRLLYLKRTPINHGVLGIIASKILRMLYSGKHKEAKIKCIENKLKNNGGKIYYASFFGDDITPFSCFKFPQKLFREPKLTLFEDYFAPCPSDPEYICELTYGNTYMEFPPVEQRVSRHKVLFMSCNDSYKKYEGIYYNKKE